MARVRAISGAPLRISLRTYWACREVSGSSSRRHAAHRSAAWAERVSGDTGQSYSVTVRRAGENLPSHHARQFCLDRQIELEDF